MIKNPIDLVKHTRFDLMFKYLYLKYKDMNTNTSYFEEMYKHHIKIWNNFTEFDNPNKNSYHKFKEIFNEISESIKKDGFNSKVSSIPVNGDYFLNGSHRVAACLYYNKQIDCYEGINGKDGQKDCSYYYLKTLNNNGVLDDGYCDRAAMEYVKLKKNTFIVSLFPSATIMGNINRVREILRHMGNLVYEKSINLTNQGSLNFIKELYYKEEWAEFNNKIGYVNKRDLCYTNNGHTIIFLVEFDSIETSVMVKQKIRDIYNLGKHSVHINDYHEETLRLSKCLFNNNSIHFMNTYNGLEYPIFEELLNKFKKSIETYELDYDNYCITAGSVLAAYGLRECKDIDYLYFGDKKLNVDESIQSHNEYGIDKYHLHKDDIIFNPNNHFYHFGIKFSSLDVVKKLKEKRGEEKDFIDIELINKIKKNNLI